MFNKVLIAASLIAATVPAVAHAAPEQTFVRNGITYSYTAVTENGRTVITGTSHNGVKPFRLVVAAGRVRGQYDRSQVSFPVPAVTTPTTVAVR